ncbi:hypothetical protein [Hymenobacter ruricola]|uniref:Uncharacterized protein n=1 Tax=Hymenobacter ruricola TaxID=2791023 RepID=A0ABS0HZB1_9BACT|nr:hypothetical protein [Hymenobacter ruricola]MBF9219982.1 hypothetical protein [Hymenobacter ruricola]
MRAAGKILVGLLLLPMALAAGYWYSQREPDKPRFYVDDTLEADVWQIPIVDPYRLIATESFNGTDPDYSRWGFQYGNDLTSFHPDSINYEKGLIIYHDALDGRYGFLDIARKTTRVPKDFSHFVTFADSVGVGRKLYAVESVYNCWQQTRQLPWGKEIFAQHCAGNTPN